MCFEYTDNPASPHELAIRVLELRFNISFHPRFAHLPPLAPGALLPWPNGSPAKTRPWTWNYDVCLPFPFSSSFFFFSVIVLFPRTPLTRTQTRSAEMAAALYALVHGPAPVPLPAPLAASAAGRDPHPSLSFRQRVKFERWFYGGLPSGEEVEVVRSGGGGVS